MIILYLLIFFLGASLGSFINMLVYRVPKNESLWGHSYNDITGERLENIDLIPIVSFVIFKGRDRKTKEKLPLIYPLIEFVSGLISSAILFILITNLSIEINLLVQFILWQILVFGLVFFSAYDYFNWSLPRKYLIGFLIVSLLILLIDHFIQSQFIISFFNSSIIAGVISAGFVAILVLISRGKGLTINDVLLAGYAGMLVGNDEILYLLLGTSILGSAFGLFAMLKAKKKVETLIQFAPILCSVTIILMFIQVSDYRILF